MAVGKEMERDEKMILGKGIVAFVMSMLMVCCVGNLFLIENCPAAGTTIYVRANANPGGDGTQDFPYKTIRDGNATARSGDTIFVFNGTYTENVVITKNLTIIGESKDSTFIDGGGNGHVIHAYGTESSDISVNVSGFTLRNAGGIRYNTIAFSYIANGEITQNKITVVDQSGGIQLYHGHGVTIQNNLISEKEVAGINLIDSEENIIQNNIIQESQEGIQFSSSSTNNQVLGNTIRNNRDCGIYVIQSSSSNVFSHNDFTGNGKNAQDSSINSWNYSGQGNYWDDYNKYDNNSDGIGDTPYNIPGGNKDYFPLGYFKQPEQPGGGNQLPIAVSLSISKTSANFGDLISFTGQGIDSDGSIVGYNWRSNLNGILSTEQSFSTSTLSIGTHTIYFKVMDNGSAWSTEKTASITINSPVNHAPTAYIDEITPNPAKQREAVLFRGHGTDEDSSIIAYKWLSSKDGVISTASSFSKTNLSLGTHTIYFQVKDSTEWSPQAIRTLVVEKNSSSNPDNQAPIADVGGPYQGNINGAIMFNGSGSHDEEGAIVGYWNFGDNSSGTGLSPTHLYTAPGTYIVTLTVTDEDGDSTTASTSVAITQSTLQGSNPEGFSVFDLEIPFPIIIIVVFLSVLGVIIGFILRMKRG